MKLWIRSQDKEILCKCDDIAYRELNKGNDNECSIVGYFNKNDDYEQLGIYKSKERALEVLDEIQNLMKSQYIVEFDDNNNPREQLELTKWYKDKYTGEFIPQPGFIKIKPINSNTLVYEMPKE